MEKETTKFNISAKKSRRDFLIKGAKVAPVITAVAAAPVWATTNANSGNQSAGMSQNSRIVKFNGFSPGYFHEHKSNGKKKASAQSASPSDQCADIQGSSKLPSWYYDMYYGGAGGVFPHSTLNAQVRVVLDPSLWKGKNNPDDVAYHKGSTITQVDRYMLTAWLNADESYGPVDYPYTQAEVLAFCKDYENRLITYDDAYIILKNLIHEGQEDFNSEEQTKC